MVNPKVYSIPKNNIINAVINPGVQPLGNKPKTKLIAFKLRVK